MKIPHDSFFIETNDGYLRLNGVIAINHAEPNLINIKTKINVQASLILRGCIEYYNFHYKRHWFKSKTKDSVSVFEGRIISITENQYNNVFKLEIINN